MSNSKNAGWHKRSKRKNIDEDKTSESKKRRLEIMLNVKNADNKTLKGKNVDGGINIEWKKRHWGQKTQATFY
jgi:hypothetical protein